MRSHFLRTSIPALFNLSVLIALFFSQNAYATGWSVTTQGYSTYIGYDSTNLTDDNYEGGKFHLGYEDESTSSSYRKIDTNILVRVYNAEFIDCNEACGTGDYWAYDGITLQGTPGFFPVRELHQCTTQTGSAKWTVHKGTLPRSVGMVSAHFTATDDGCEGVIPCGEPPCYSTGHLQLTLDGPCDFGADFYICSSELSPAVLDFSMNSAPSDWVKKEIHYTLLPTSANWQSASLSIYPNMTAARNSTGALYNQSIEVPQGVVNWDGKNNAGKFPFQGSQECVIKIVAAASNILHNGNPTNVFFTFYHKVYITMPLCGGGGCGASSSNVNISCSNPSPSYNLFSLPGADVSVKYRSIHNKCDTFLDNNDLCDSIYA